MRILKLVFKTKEQLQTACRSSSTGLRVPERTHLTAGEEVMVELRIRPVNGRVFLAGTVKSWTPASPRHGRAATVEFLFSPAELSKVDALLGASEGQLDLAKRKYPRYPVSLPITFLVPGESQPRTGELGEISRGGAFLRADSEPLDVGEDVVIHVLLPGGAVPVPLRGKVASRSQGGVGISFACRDTGGNRRLRELVNRIKVS